MMKMVMIMISWRTAAFPWIESAKVSGGCFYRHTQTHTHRDLLNH